MARRNTSSSESNSRPIAHHCCPIPEHTKTGVGDVPEMRPVEQLLRSSPQIRLELLDQLGLVVRHQCQAELMVRSLRVCSKTDVAQGFAMQATLLAERVQVGPREIRQRRRAARGEQQHPRAAVIAGDRRGAVGLGRGFQDRMSVGAAEPEGIDARPGRLTVGCGHGCSCCATRSCRSSKGICGFGHSKWRLAGIRRCRRHSAALISPAIPAAASRCPTLLLIEPITHRSPRRRACPYTAPRAAASMGSPTGVPVPCASTYCTEPGGISASRKASTMHAFARLDSETRCRRCGHPDSPRSRE